MSWRRLFPIIFLFSCVDGFISNLFYPARLPFLYKDILILIVYILFLIKQEPGKQWMREFKKNIGYGTWYLAMLLILLGGVQIFNPHVLRLEVAILGFKTMFFYWPLAILAYAYVNTPEHAMRFLKKIVYLSIPLCIFGLYQFWQSPDFMVNKFGPGFQRAMIFTGGGDTGYFLRVFSTFGASGQFTHFLVINIMLIFGLLFNSTSKLEKLILGSCLVLNYVTLLATGSRTGLLLLFPTVFFFLIFCRWLWRTFLIIFILAVSLNFGFNYLGASVLDRFESVKDVEMVKTRTIGVTIGMFKDYLEEYPFGLGIGMATPASRYLLQEDAPVETHFIENYATKLQAELGIAGVILFYLLLLKLVTHWARHWLKFIERKSYILIIALTSYCWSIFFLISTFGILDTAPIAIFLWAEVGMVAKLTTLNSDDKYFVST